VSTGRRPSSPRNASCASCPASNLGGFEPQLTVPTTTMVVEAADDRWRVRYRCLSAEIIAW
jgi:hypothetical protein